MKKYKTEIKWTLIFSAVVLLWMWLEKISGLHSTYLDYHLYLTNLFAIPAILMFVLALKDKKKNDYGGRMRYGQGVVSGIILSVMVALLSPLTQWMTSYVITPEYFPNVIRRSVETGYFKTNAAAAAHFNFQNYAIMGALNALVMGIVVTLVVMLFLRTKKRQAEMPVATPA